ncbi:alpha-ketoglutarate-dependent 2 [Colletotrichum tamarilloi]|uniref:Alpha-ketoglutarate-dependent 2 n=1 Tax=Colletotrichum tamarilloi TaxID=1209934 RepID=A0ABQ9QL09_9PEZI|nr:alpha-ketoglutarate-dependent 2 [Colletotrichum tamarilloi]KAK1475881.1 alpha-ketoglutarate-dependent 2 [Colletotrichum tamarilloi]
MPLTIEPLHPTFAAEIRGVDFSKPLTEDVFQEIQAAITKYGVLVFPATGLDDKRHVAFASLFGELERRKDTGGPSRMSLPELTDQGNVDANGNVISSQDPRAQISKGNTLFHVDSSFNAQRASYSILLAHEVPPLEAGGNTDFADTPAAWDGLPEEWKQELISKDYVAGHSFWYSRKKACPDFFTKLEPAKHPMSKHKIAQLHEASGRMNLFVPSHCHHIEGLDGDEGREKLEYLYRHATQDKFMFSVPWKQVGDLVMWDNTCTLHRGTPVVGGHRRDMRRATVLDGSQEAWGLNEKVERDFAFAGEVMADVFRCLSEFHHSIFGAPQTPFTLPPSSTTSSTLFSSILHRITRQPSLQDTMADTANSIIYDDLVAKIKAAVAQKLAENESAPDATRSVIVQRKFIKIKMNRHNLDTMPNEVLGMITTLCHDHAGGGRENLRNLCLVSKRIHNIARRELYFITPIQTPHQLACIVRTLIEQPSTRKLIHDVLINIDTNNFTGKNPAASFYRQFSFTQLDDSKLSARDRQLLVLCKATCGTKAPENLQCILGLFMFLLENTHHVTIRADNYLSIADRFLTAGLCILAPNSSNNLDYSPLFPSLVSLDLISKTWLQRSSQTFFGKVFQPTLALAASSPLLVDFGFKGPEGELTSVLMHCGSDVKFPFKKLLLRGSDWTASSLCVLLRRCPKVEHLEVETIPDKDNYLIGQNINRVLPKYCPELRVLSIRFFGNNEDFFGPRLTLTCLPKMDNLRELRIEIDAFVREAQHLGDLDLAEKLPDRLEKLFLDASSVKFPGKVTSKTPAVLAHKEHVKRIIEDLCETRAEEIPLPRLDTIAIGCKYSKPKQWTRVANDTMADTDAKLRVYTAADAKTLWAKSFDQMNV